MRLALGQLLGVLLIGIVMGRLLSGCISGGRSDFDMLKSRLSSEEFDQIRLIQECPSYDRPYRCREVVNAANKLISLGRDKSVAAMSVYLKMAEKQNGSFDLCPYKVALLCRLVYDECDGATLLHDPVYYLNTPSAYTSEQMAKSPYFPIIWLEGVPFLIGMPTTVSFSSHKYAIAKQNLDSCVSKCSFKTARIAFDPNVARYKLDRFLASSDFELLLNEEKLSKSELHARKRETASFLSSQLD